MLRGQVGAIECEARQRAAELEERSAEKMRKATDLVPPAVPDTDEHL